MSRSRTGRKSSLDNSKLRFLLEQSRTEFRVQVHTDYHDWCIKPAKVTDLALLQTYRQRLIDDLEVTHIGADKQQREWADKVAEHKRDVDARISELEFEQNNDWIVPYEEIERIRSLSIPSSYYRNGNPRKADWDEWRHVFEEYSLEELTFIRNAIYNFFSSGMETTYRGKIIDMFRFKKGDETVSVDDIVTMTNRGKGANRSTVITHAEHTFNALDPVIAGFIVSWLTEIKRNLEPQKSRSGFHSREGKTINISTESKWESATSSTTAHELSHVLHYMLGLYEDDSTTDNRDKPRSEWCSIINTIEKDMHMHEYSNTMVNLWMDFQQETIEPLTTYQTKNFDEFTTVAFETWIADPSTLQEKQPELYELFETFLSDDRNPPRATITEQD